MDCVLQSLSVYMAVIIVVAKDPYRAKIQLRIMNNSMPATNFIAAGLLHGRLTVTHQNCRSYISVVFLLINPHPIYECEGDTILF